MKRYAIRHGYREMGKKFEKGFTIWGEDSNPDTIWEGWSDRQAWKMIDRFHCEYKSGFADEYALEIYEADEDGEFIDGSDFELARERRNYWTADKETGTHIDRFDTYYEAVQAIAEYEKEDDEAVDFYDIVNDEHESIESPLEEVRKSKKMTVPQLAKLSGVNTQMIYKYEQGIKDIQKASVYTVCALADALVTNVRDIVDC